jgi:hypothetical protein
MEYNKHIKNDKINCTKPYWWPTMTRDIQSFIKQYANYKQIKDNTIIQQKNDSTKIDWRIPIVTDFDLKCM